MLLRFLDREVRRITALTPDLSGDLTFGVPGCLVSTQLDQFIPGLSSRILFLYPFINKNVK